MQTKMTIKEDKVEEQTYSIKQLKELFEAFCMRTPQKEVISIEDMRIILGGVSYNAAAKKIREVKSISDCLNISGIIHLRDWEAYLNKQQKIS